MATDTTVSNGQKDEHALEQVEAKEQELRNAFGKMMLECGLDWENADSFLRYSIKEAKTLSLEKRWTGACKVLARLQKI